MNVVKIMGGLGNQLFQYAFAKSLERLGPVALDVSYYTSDFNKRDDIPHREYLLNFFADDLRYELQEDRKHIKGNRWLLLRNSEELDDMQQIRLHDLLYSFPAFEKPHSIKEKFREIYMFSKTRSEAEKAYEEWKTTITDYPEYLAFADLRRMSWTNTRRFRYAMTA